VALQHEQRVREQVRLSFELRAAITQIEVSALGLDAVVTRAHDESVVEVQWQRGERRGRQRTAHVLEFL